MNCPDELTLSIHADGELTDDEARTVEAHVHECRACSALLSSLVQEAAVLTEALGTEEAVVLGLTPSPHAQENDTRGWLWGGLAVAAATPFLLDFVWHALPSLPGGLRWLGNLGGVGGIFSISRGLFELTLGGEDMLVSWMGFGATLFVVVGVLAMRAVRQPALAGTLAAAALAIVAGLGPSSPAAAAEYRYEEEGTVTVEADESIDDTVFLGGKTAIVSGTVDGDVFAAAERVEVTGKVLGNLYSAGESVSIAGDVSGNIHAAGKNVEVDGKAGGSGFFAGQTVIFAEGGELAHGGFFAGETVRSRGRVGRGLQVAAEKVEISGSVARDVSGYAEHFAVTSTSRIGGDLNVTVTDEDAVEVDEGATIGGATTIDIHEARERRAFMHAGFYFGVIGKTLALLLIGFVLVTLFPSLRPKAPESSRDALRDMGIGFVTIIAAPVAMLIVAITIIGIPIAIMLAIAYALLLFFSKLVVAYFAGERLPISREGGTGVALRTGVALVVLLFVLEIPFVGGALGFVVSILGVGVLVLHLRDLYVHRRGPAGPSEALVAG